jgi:hypothetical protein
MIDSYKATAIVGTVVGLAGGVGITMAADRPDRTGATTTAVAGGIGAIATGVLVGLVFDNASAGLIGLGAGAIVGGIVGRVTAGALDATSGAATVARQ